MLQSLYKTAWRKYLVWNFPIFIALHMAIRLGGRERGRRRLPLHLHPLAFFCLYALVHNSNHSTKFFLFLSHSFNYGCCCFGCVLKSFAEMLLQDKLQPFLFIFLNNGGWICRIQQPGISIQSAFLPHLILCFTRSYCSLTECLQPES